MFSNENDVINGIANSGTGFGCRQMGWKNSLTSVAGFYYSTWLSTGLNPGSAPSTFTVPTDATAGSWDPLLNDATGGSTNCLLQFSAMLPSPVSLVIHDRLGHVGGLSGTSTSAQTVSLTLTAQATSNRCSSTGAGVDWWLEWYTATGSTAVTATITYTNQAGTTGKTTTVSLPASVPASRMYPISVLASGDTAIQSIQSVTLSATTGTAGSFGVTATRTLALIPSAQTTNGSVAIDYAALGMPVVGTGACISGYVLATTTTTGNIQYNIVIGAA